MHQCHEFHKGLQRYMKWLSNSEIFPDGTAFQSDYQLKEDQFSMDVVEDSKKPKGGKRKTSPKVTLAPLVSLGSGGENKSSNESDNSDDDFDALLNSNRFSYFVRHCWDKREKDADKTHAR